MYEKLRTHQLNQWLIIHLRYLLGVAFLPSGLTKIVGNRFTQISTDHPIGFFFEGLYQSGIYYNFIGVAQVLAALLLMTQRFATLGAVVYYSLIVNIWLITVSLSFKGTWVITSLMLLACTVLLVWDYQKLKGIFAYNTAPKITLYPDPDRLWQAAGIIYFVFILAMSAFPADRLFPKISAVMVVITFVVSNRIAYKRYKKGRKFIENINPTMQQTKQ